MAELIPLTIESLGSPDVGDRVLWLLTHTQQWIHRRVESIEFRDNRTVARKVSIDFTVVDAVPEFLLANGAPFRLVPLTVLRKRKLINFDLHDEAGRSLPILTAAQNTAVGTAVLGALAAGILGRDPTGIIINGTNLQTTLASIAGTRTREAIDEALTGREQKVGPVLKGDAQFNHVADLLAQGFIGLVPVSSRPGIRRIIKYSHEEPVDITALSWAGDIIAALGWMSKRYVFNPPAVDSPESFHFEVRAPDGVDVTRAEIIVTRPPIGAAQSGPPASSDWAGGGSPRVHLHARGVPSGTQGRVRVFVRASRRGWLTFAVFSISINAIILIAGLIWLSEIASKRLPVPSNGLSSALALLLAVPAVASTVLVRPREHAVAARLLVGIRVLLGVAGLQMYAAAAVFVALPASDPRLLRIWRYLMISAVAMACMAFVSWLVPVIRKRDPRGAKATV